MVRDVHYLHTGVHVFVDSNTHGFRRLHRGFFAIGGSRALGVDDDCLQPVARRLFAGTQTGRNGPRCTGMADRGISAAAGAGFVDFFGRAYQLGDVAQFVWGSPLGRHKIAPNVSPGKTVEGF